MKYYPRGFFGTAKNGSPLYIDRSGKIDATKLQEACPMERFEKGYYQVYELMVKKYFLVASQQFGKQITRTYSICDLAGYTYGEAMANRHFL